MHDHAHDDHDHAHGHHDDHHGHGHSHLPAGAGDGAILGAVAVNLILTAAQIIGGGLAGSVALIADGVHNLSDALSLVLAFGARKLARRGASPEMSFGWERAEIIAAFLNYAALIVISLWLGYEAIGRLIDPPAVEGRVVMALATLAIVVNSATAALVWRASRDSMNLRAALMHNLTDALVSVAVLIGGVCVWAFGWRIVDPLLTILISGAILWHVARDMMPSLRILMLGTPPEIDTSALRAGLHALPDVVSSHDLHLWQIDERRSSAQLHLVVRDGADLTATIRQAKALLARDFGIHHATIEIETETSGCAGPVAGLHP